MPRKVLTEFGQRTGEDIEASQVRRTGVGIGADPWFVWVGDHVPGKADANSYRNSKNKKYLRKIEAQKAHPRDRMHGVNR